MQEGVGLMPNVCVYPDKDCFIDKYRATTVFDSAELYVDLLYVGGGKTENSRTLIHFTIPAEVNSAEVYKAYLCLYRGVSSAYSPVLLDIVHITQGGWLEAHATWNVYKALTNWATAGGDYDDVAPEPSYKSISIANPWNGFLEIDITDMVTYAITNHSRSLDLLLKLSDELIDFSQQITTKSKDQPLLSTPERRPYLNIIRPPFGLPMEV